MADKIRNELAKTFSLKETKIEEFAKLKVNGMNFDVTSYDIEGVGNLGIMKASGFFGLMSMVTLIINPFEKDAPLLSYDRINAFGNDTLILELYDTTLENNFDVTKIAAVKERNASLPVYDHGTHWYDNILMKESVHLKAKKKAAAGFDKLVDEYVKEYIIALEKAENCDIEAKKAKAKQYSDGLLNNGGPSTDIFVKKFGQQFTRDLFEKILFGTNKQVEQSSTFFVL